MSFGGFYNPFLPPPDQVVPDGPNPSDLSIYEWARFDLTGDLEATEPDNATLTPIAQSVVSEWKLSTSCYFNGTPTPDDVKAYNEAIGAEVASRFLGGITGGQFAALVQSVELGPVLERITAGKDVVTLAIDLRNASASARLRISCVRASLTNNPVPRGNFFGLAGERRSKEANCGCSGVYRGRR